MVNFLINANQQQIVEERFLKSVFSAKYQHDVTPLPAILISLYKKELGCNAASVINLFCPCFF